MKTGFQQISPMSPAILHILLALAAEDRHGYGIIREIARQSNGHYKVGPGTLYDNLKKLMDAGLVADTPKSASASNEDRRFYRLTLEGRSALAAEIDRLQTVIHDARSRLQELRLNDTRPKRV